MAKIAVSVLCAWCRNKKYLRKNRCLKNQTPDVLCNAFIPCAKMEEAPDLIAWVEREMEK